MQLTWVPCLGSHKDAVPTQAWLSSFLELGGSSARSVVVSRLQWLVVMGPRSRFLGGCQLGLVSAPYEVALSQVL